MKRNGQSAITEPFTPQKTTNQTKDNNKMSSKSNSTNQEPIEIPETNSNDKQKVIKKGFTNNQISKSRVFCKIFILTSVKKEEYKYNNEYYVLDTEELNKNIKIKNNNTIVSSISRDMQINEIKETNSKIIEKLQYVEEICDIEKITIDAL